MKKRIRMILDIILENNQFIISTFVILVIVLLFVSILRIIPFSVTIPIQLLILIVVNIIIAYEKSNRKQGYIKNILLSVISFLFAVYYMTFL
ncbi:hypothetical protein [Anaeromicropila populeti]|uniref:Uncharacterized protein n=1 Tax=Anaeromicropila populeti TaxID=37658 RepID=A0A1I6IWM6_9FIRM|nr:hypothetical protein [Anaeromicropila populeti]SFR71108.1 hypothetical protein SAMN05661086_01190 [Anaeromicropila populeti]